MIKTSLAGLAACVAGLSGSAALGAVNVSQGASAPTYATTLTFDEVGGPTGANVPSNAWTGVGITSMVSGSGANAVTNVSAQPGFGWLGTGNVFYGPFGVFINFGSDLTEFSAQFWDSSGPASGFGGGAAVIAFNDGVEVGFLFVTNPAFGGAGNTWIDITTDSGSVFDEVRLLGFGFFPESYVDNLSWNAVPAPASALVAGLGLFAAARRRRA
ncbi:MAG: hypothetical protein IBJ10_06125 [Phycisphaerales bacterium]|nr:hypothetical protein [Phycisphaerales bacterium]